MERASGEREGRVSEQALDLLEPGETNGAAGRMYVKLTNGDYLGALQAAAEGVEAVAAQGVDRLDQSS